MTVAARKQPITPEEFLAWEQQQAERYEFVGGKVRLMVGGTIGHNDFTDNVQAALRTRLRGTPCRARAVQTRVQAADGSYMYPDIVVSCTPRRPDELFIDDPILVVEVLSPSTANYDLTEKRWAYLPIPSLRQLVYISPDKAKLELFTREPDDSWRSVIITGLAADLPLACLDLTIPMAEIYADTAVARPPAETG